MPMLMIPTEKSPEKRSLYRVLANRVYLLELTMPYKHLCCGSSHGWLAIVDQNDIITWVNPFKNVAPISLPRIDVPNSYTTRKVVYTQGNFTQGCFPWVIPTACP
jgi:hypothetical protein